MIIENTGDIPEKTANQTLVDYTECLTDWYIVRTPIKYRKEKGQYFTLPEVSEFMIKQFENISEKGKLRILDPGAGVGIFESTFCESIKSLEKNIRISFDLYENDINLVTLLGLNMMACAEDMASNGFKVTYRVINKDFILSNASIFNNRNNLDTNKKGYDLVISNPPYYKLRKNSPQVVKTKNIINGSPNIYPIFMALSAKLLKHDGEMLVLTPRSYCSGLYFKNFRKWFFEIVKPCKIHLFNSRRDVFKKYNVLQENIILTAIKTSTIPKNILVSVSNGPPNENEKLIIRSTAYDRVVVKKGEDLLMRIPTSDLDDLIAVSVDKLGNNLNTLGFKVSTGPVVPFRAKNFLFDEVDIHNDFVPLIWMHNIVNGTIKWPIEQTKKPIGIMKTDEFKKILIPNKNYILIKRFSTKEGKQRINAGVYLNKILNTDLLGVENHVNYVYKKEEELTSNEAYGIASLLNSRLYNRYFQITNGNTQVNASEIGNLPLPTLEIIREIGKSMRNSKRINAAEKEKIILRALKIDENIENELITKR